MGPYVTRVSVSATDDGANTIVAAVASHRITVLDYVLTTIGTGGFIWKSNTTALSGTITPVAGTPIVAPYNDNGYLVTAPGEALIATTAAGVDLTGHMTVRIEQ